MGEGSRGRRRKGLSIHTKNQNTRFKCTIAEKFPVSRSFIKIDDEEKKVNLPFPWQHPLYDDAQY